MTFAVSMCYALSVTVTGLNVSTTCSFFTISLTNIHEGTTLVAKHQSTPLSAPPLIQQINVMFVHCYVTTSKRNLQLLHTYRKCSSSDILGAQPLP